MKEPMAEDIDSKVIPFPADKVRSMFEEKKSDSAEISRLREENTRLRTTTLPTAQEEMDEPARKAVGTIADAAASRVKEAMSEDLGEMRSLSETIRGDRNKSRFDAALDRVSKSDYSSAIADTFEGHYQSVIDANPKMDRADALVQAEKNALFEAAQNGTFAEKMREAESERSRASSTRTTANGRSASEPDVTSMNGQQLVDSNKLDEAYEAFAGRKSHF